MTVLRQSVLLAPCLTLANMDKQYGKDSAQLLNCCQCDDCARCVGMGDLLAAAEIVEVNPDIYSALLCQSFGALLSIISAACCTAT